MVHFRADHEKIKQAMRNPMWETDSGLGIEEIEKGCKDIAVSMPHESHMRVKTRIMAYILDHAQLCINPYDIFEARLRHNSPLIAYREHWQQEAENSRIAESIRATHAGQEAGVWNGSADYSHTAPDWDRLLALGVPGILDELSQTRHHHLANGTLSREKADYYDGCIETWKAIQRFLLRREQVTRRCAENPVCQLAADLTAPLARRAPQTFAEALAMICIIYEIQTSLEGSLVRSLGRLDRHLLSFYRGDIALGRCSPAELDEVLRFFYFHFDAMHHPNNVPLCLGGGADGPNELSWRMQKIYDTLGLYCPKFQIRVTESTPDDFLMRALDAIRRGNSSYVFVNDDVVVAGLTQLGEQKEDAENYVPIGCYEPMALGKELPCTCAGLINLPKLVELTLNDGLDPRSGRQIGPHTGDAELLFSAAQFEGALKKQIAAAIHAVQERIRAYDSVLSDLNPSPVLSATYLSSVERGVDVYSGGAVYNTSSINCIGLANAVDAILAIREVVFTEKRLTLAQLRDVLKLDWKDAQALKKYILLHCKKYGTGDREADACACELSAFCAARINGVHNARGGAFRMGLFSIDWIFSYGERTGATADGRACAEPLTRNLCAVVGMDREGPTALLRSVTALNASEAVNGAVIDMMIHPSAVQGDAGLHAMLAMLRTFCRKGGQSIQFNVLDADTLRDAQRHPEKYASLQVRVCGWNAYFIDLRPQEQEILIRHAEGRNLA